MNNNLKPDNENRIESRQSNGIFLSNKKILIGVIIIVCILVVFVIFNSSDNNKNNLSKPTYPNYNPDSDNSNYDSNEESNSKNKYSFNETFIFDDLEITIGNEYSFVIVDNRYSDYNKKAAVKLPITVKNIKSETHGLNMFDYNVYGSQGTEVKNLAAYFDDDIDSAGDLRTGAQYTKYLYFLYDGDGNYAIEFDDFYDKIEVEFEIKK